MFSLLFGIYLIVELLFSLGKRIPYFELMFALFGVQLLISPYADYHYFHNQILAVMEVPESVYYEFVTFAILGLYIGFKLLTSHIKDNELVVRKAIKTNSQQYENIGFNLIIFGYFFFFLTFLSSNFVFVSLSYLRFIGSLYILYSNSSRKLYYMLLVWLPFFIITVKSVVFINIIIWTLLLYCFFNLNKRVRKILIVSLALFGFTAISILQSVKHVYRESAWDPNARKELSLTSLMINQAKNLDAELLKLIGGAMNLRVNQGWIISHGMNNLGDNDRNLSKNYLKQEMIGIFLPRFIYKDKVVVGSREKFYEFTGWELGGGTAMNLGIIGDLYLNFGKRKGIVAGFIFGLILGWFHSIYLRKLILYPDLLFWSVLFYFMIMRAGNEFYIIMNWYFKTILIVTIFFSYLRPRFLENMKPQFN